MKLTKSCSLIAMFLLLFLLPLAVIEPLSAEDNPVKPHVFFVNLVDGQSAKFPLKVEMGVSGMTVAPAGTFEPDTGHHHLIIDGQPIPKGEVVPADATHIHFGKGQTYTTIDLKPGQHTLTLQFADGAHISYGPELSSTITISGWELGKQLP